MAINLVIEALTTAATLERNTTSAKYVMLISK